MLAEEAGALERFAQTDQKKGTLKEKVASAAKEFEPIPVVPEPPEDLPLTDGDKALPPAVLSQEELDTLRTCKATTVAELRSSPEYAAAIAARLSGNTPRAFTVGSDGKLRDTPTQVELDYAAKLVADRAVADEATRQKVLSERDAQRVPSQPSPAEIVQKYRDLIEGCESLRDANRLMTSAKNDMQIACRVPR